MKQAMLIDYGSGNLTSAAKALDKIAPPNFKVSRTADAKKIIDADYLILPGVGAFGDCIHALTNANMKDQVVRHIESGKPFLGICVGMQLLAEMGLEHGTHQGLGLIKGQVEMLPKAEGLAIPNIGWHPVQFMQDHALHKDLHAHQSWFYFVHSYYFKLQDKAFIAMQMEYDIKITASIAKDNIYACQFHPEKSQQTGLRLLANFLTWSP